MSEVRIRRFVLLDKNFRRYWVAGLLSTSGMWCWRTLAPIMIYQNSSSPLMLGIFSVASYGPVLLFSFVGGTFADRFDKRRISALFQGCTSVLFLLLAMRVMVAGISPAIVCGAAVLEGIFYALAKPSMQSLLYEIVDPQDLTRAVSINTSQYSIAQLIGPIMATMLSLRYGYGAALIFSSLLYIPLIVNMATLHTRRVMPRYVGDVKVKKFGKLRQAPEFSHLAILLLAVALGSVAIEGGVRVLAPEVALNVLGNENSAGYIISAQAFGGILGILVISLFAGRIGDSSLFRLGFVSLAFVLGFYATIRTSEIVLGLAVLVGAAHSLSFNVLTALIHKRSPDLLRGRVLSLHSMALLGTRPFSGLIAGSLSARLGWRFSTGVFALIALTPLCLRIGRDTEHPVSKSLDSLKS
ncbi:MAG: MFS transporter [Ilumatobacteraceae bacterium]